MFLLNDASKIAGINACKKVFQTDGKYRLMNRWKQRMKWKEESRKLD